MRLLVTRDYPEEVLAPLRTSWDIEAVGYGELNAQDALVRYDAVFTTIGDAWAAEAFDGAPHRCKLLANFGVGYSHIDADAARRAGVAVTNTPGATTEPTADVALMLMLMSCRRAGEAERMVRAGDWSGWVPFGPEIGMALGRKTLGIIGLGRIGEALARRAEAMGMTVIYASRSEKERSGRVEMGELLGRADVVALTVPGGPETRHMIGAEELSKMKPHARLVNVSRGDVVDEAALAAALEAGRIGGAGLDVYEEEPRIHPGLFRENVVLLPHIGTADQGVRVEMGLMVTENLMAFAEGRPLPNLVNP